VICEETVEKSKAFALKQNLEYKHKYVLMPKATGLFHILRSLRKKSEYLYDITVAYSGHDKSVYAYDYYSPNVVFGEGNGPKSVHMHVDRFRIDDIPGISDQDYDPEETTTPEFEEWIRNRFIEKDQLMGDFFARGVFPQQSADGSGCKEDLILKPNLEDWLSISGLILGSVTSLSWIFHKTR
jgi:Acyltransferase C-terminus